MKRIAFGLCLASLLFPVVGCEPKLTEQEQIFNERTQQYHEDLETWKQAGEASLLLTDKLREEMSYEEVNELFGFEGEKKMDVRSGEGDRKVYEWVLDGGVTVRVTFDEGSVTKWSIR